MTEKIFEADGLYAVCKRSDLKLPYAWCHFELLSREEYYGEDGSISGAGHAKTYLREKQAVALASFILSNLAETYSIEEAEVARDAVKKLCAKKYDKEEQAE